MVAEKTGTAVDAFTTEVIRSALVAITGEMKQTLQKTAYNEIIYEAEDFTVGLFDADGNTLSIGLGLPTFIGGLSATIKAKVAHWGKDGIEPGDILLTNDAYVHGSHLNHMIFTIPVFNDGELMGFASSEAHWREIGGVVEWDVGGYAGPITRDIYSEGLQLPFVKYYRAGVPNQELAAIIRANVRRPDSMMGDLRAQIAAARTGERRLAGLLARYGNEAFRASVQDIFDTTERIARHAVTTIKDGVYEAESFMDDDGVNAGKHIPVRVKVIVEGDQMTVDLSEMSPQVAGYFNSGEASGRSFCQVAFKMVTTPLLLPINEGAVRPLKVILPPGKICSAVRPAPMRWWMSSGMTILDTILKALAPACPERVIAAHHADLVGGGGWGAKCDEDGMTVTQCSNDGDTHNAPVEASEAKNPWIIVQRAIRVDSGGPGKFRGGLGKVEETIRTRPTGYSAKTERTICAPWGLFGGKDALANRIGVRRKDGTVQRFPTGKVLPPIDLDAGDSSIIETGGGGGWGDPRERAPELVLKDVRDGYVSVESARRDYGVAITHSGRHYELDLSGTQSLRRDMVATGLTPPT